MYNYQFENFPVWKRIECEQGTLYDRYIFWGEQNKERRRNEKKKNINNLTRQRMLNLNAVTRLTFGDY